MVSLSFFKVLFWHNFRLTEKLQGYISSTYSLPRLLKYLNFTKSALFFSLYSSLNHLLVNCRHTLNTSAYISLKQGLILQNHSTMIWIGKSTLIQSSNLQTLIEIHQLPNNVLTTIYIPIIAFSCYVSNMGIFLSLCISWHWHCWRIQASFVEHPQFGFVWCFLRPRLKLYNSEPE